MKKLFFNLIPILVLIASCHKSDDQSPTPTPATITHINPAEAIKGTEITLTGNNFGTNSSAVQVFFNGKEAAITSITNTQIKVKVPPRAYTGNVTVKMNGNTSNGPVFTYLISDVQVGTFAGSTIGYNDATGTAAQFNTPAAIAFGADGTMYVADRSNHKIRSVSPQGVVNTLAGSVAGYADGTGTAAKFNIPIGLVVGTDGNIYVSDMSNHKIRKVTPQGVVTTLAGSTAGNADGAGVSAQFFNPFGITTASDGTLYVADFGNSTIRKMTLNGNVTTFAGGLIGDINDVGLLARFKTPSGIVYGTDGNLYVADNGNHKIKKIQPDGKVTTLAGSIQGSANGVGTAAQFNFPHSIAMSPDGYLYVSDLYNHIIRKISLNGNVKTLAGMSGSAGFMNGEAEDAVFNEPNGLAATADGTLYIADFNNHKIRKITQE
jgi:sugar lactone lactonase YvrE